MEATAKYRLPTEAEWEYAARAGVSTAYPFGEAAQRLADAAWFGQVGNVGARPVGQRSPNAFGLYDMLGNVWEWVQDCWNPDYSGAPEDGRAWLSGDCGTRVLRGGGWDSQAPYVRFAVRGSYPADFADLSNGFRLARSP
jgi:formylglycine-generating enzyme required for sulfatase activity